MKSPIKVALFLASGLLVLGLLAWVGTFLYWHIRITAALRGIESSLGGSQRAYGESYDLLLAAKCRSLPYLANAMDPSKPEWLLRQYQFFIMTNGKSGGGRDDELNGLQGRFWIDPIDSPELIREKCDGWRAWWKESGSRYHQWWRVWSSCCRRD